VCQVRCHPSNGSLRWLYQRSVASTATGSTGNAATILSRKGLRDRHATKHRLDADEPRLYVGHGEHSVEAKRHALEHYFRPAIAQLALLHVSEASRAAGIGSRLCDDLELMVRGVGDSEMVVSATPSENTVRFYLGRGYELMAEPLPELSELEPEDVHMKKGP
jgi:GNAT superfamily N-acetyltransferase